MTSNWECTILGWYLWLSSSLFLIKSPPTLPAVCRSRDSNYLTASGHTNHWAMPHPMSSATRIMAQILLPADHCSVRYSLLLGYSIQGLGCILNECFHRRQKNRDFRQYTALCLILNYSFAKLGSGRMGGGGMGMTKRLDLGIIWTVNTLQYPHTYSRSRLTRSRRLKKCSILRAACHGVTVIRYSIQLLSFVIQYCFTCRPSDSTVSEDAGIEPLLLRLWHWQTDGSISSHNACTSQTWDILRKWFCSN